ncbi:hypothetical protein BV881_18350 [Streptomyces sp. ZL-24]|nr:hypothetical protein BV881_18350 [Streptomyces sp. ZL-24]
MGGVVDGLDDDGDEQSLYFVAGQRDQVGGVGGPVVFVGPDDGEEGMGEHRQSDPAGPGHESSDLMLIKSGQTLSGLEGLLHPPP